MRWYRHLDKLGEERDLRYQQRFDMQQQALEFARISIKDAVDQALTDINGRLALLNELRSGVATKVELDALEKIVQEVRASVDELRTLKAGAQSQTRAIYAAIGAMVGLVTLALILGPYLPG